MSMTAQLNLPESHSEQIFEFIRTILPSDSCQPISYYLFKKLFEYDLIKEIKLCHICQSELNKDKNCPTESCASKRMDKIQNLKKSIKIVTADTKIQLEIIIKNNYDSIVKHLRKNMFYHK